MDNEENQKQVSLVAHSSWKSLRDSHISTAPTAFPDAHSDTNYGTFNVCRGKVEIEKHDSHFSTAPTAYGVRKEISSSPIKSQQTPTKYLNRKEAWRRIASLPPPGSFLD